MLFETGRLVSLPRGVPGKVTLQGGGLVWGDTADRAPGPWRVRSQRWLPFAYSQSIVTNAAHSQGLLTRPQLGRGRGCPHT